MARSKKTKSIPSSSPLTKQHKKSAKISNLEAVREAVENEKVADEIDEILSEIEDKRAELRKPVSVAAPEIQSEQLDADMEEAVLVDDDVAQEVSYWSTAVIVYVLGANPPTPLLTGFLKRVWVANGI